MSEMEEKLGALLKNPQAMQQLLAMAQALGGGGTPQAETSAPSTPPPQEPAVDPRLLQSLAGLSRQGTGVNPEQQTLLSALSPFVSARRIQKLERAMRAAKMAGFATEFLNSGGLQMLGGR